MTETSAPLRCLLVDGDGSAARAIDALLDGSRASCRLAPDASAALRLLETEAVDALIVELEPSEDEVVALIEQVGSRWPDVAIIALSADPANARAARALRLGATEVLDRRIERSDLDRALAKVRRLVEHGALQPVSPLISGGLLGSSPPMRQAYRLLERAAAGNATVLIRGESGTGKELAARALHDQSARAARPFVKIDCTALPEALLESELFGYEKGAFTGATARKLGRVELADGGTLFLDEIGELTLALQAKLLRLLQDRRFDRLGSTTTTAVDVRIVAATHRDLEAMIQRGEFRQDLFYRLNVVAVWLPPLRARRDDITELALHFAAKLAKEYGKPEIELTAGAQRLLHAQRWPGNVRQLQNFIERLVALSDGTTIDERDVQSELDGQIGFVTQAEPQARPATSSGASSPDPPADAGAQHLSTEVRSAERRAIARALEQARGNRTVAARLLGISRSFLYKKLEEHDLD